MKIRNFGQYLKIKEYKEHTIENFSIGDRVKLLGYFNGQTGFIKDIKEDKDLTLYIIQLDNIVYNPNPVRFVSLPARNLKKI